MPSRLLFVRWWASLLAFVVLLILFFNASPAWAEGSRSLYPSDYLTQNTTGTRANLDVSEPNSRYVNRVVRRGFLYVYAQAGEYILLGSRNRSNSGDIRVYNPQSFGVPGDETVPATADFTCSGGSTQPGTHFSGGTRGTITTRAQEVGGPTSANTATSTSDNFSPCAYQAPVTGIYGVVFTGATGAGIGGPNGAIDPPALSSATVSAWDVTVRAGAASTTDINGRLFTYAFIGFTGGNNRPLYSTHYYITSDGYRYQQDLRGLDPNGYALYANSLGFLDNGQPLYKDLRGNEPLVTSLPPGVAAQLAEYPIFFSDVSPTGPNNAEINRVLGALSIPIIPPSPTLSDLSFTGNLSGSTSTVGAGGTFRFNTTDTITYQIVISRDGTTFDPNNPLNRVLTGIARTGTHTIVWDGKDGGGANFPPGTYPFRITGRNGEVHFPIIDAENNSGGGPTITRLNGPNSPNLTVYFDDRGYITSSGTRVGNLNGTLCPAATPAAPNPPVGLGGVDSSTAYRAWQSGSNRNGDCVNTPSNNIAGWGDAKGLDLWAYFSTPEVANQLIIQPIIVDVATSVTAPAVATAGSTVQGSFSFANNGTSLAAGVTYGLQLTSGLGTVTFDNLPPGVTATYNNTTGQVTFTGLPATLNPGQSFSGLTFSYTAPASGPVTATTAITTTSPDTFPDNNTDSATTQIGATDVFTQVNVPASADPGTPVNGSFVFGNNGNTTAQVSSYSATIGSPGNFPPNVTFTGLPSGVTASYDPSNGQVTFTGLPATLAPSQSFNFAFTYTGPSSGSIPVNTGITTTSVDADPTNNAASGATNFARADLGVTKTNNVTSVSPGTPTTYTVVVTNSGPAAADGAVITDPVAAGLSKTDVTCAASAGAVCPGSPTVAQLEGSGVVIPTLPASGSLTFTITANVTATVGTAVTNVARIAPPSGVTDPNLGNNTARDSDTVVSLPPPPPPGGTVTGTVFNDLNGDGIQELGENGIGGVTVRLLDSDGNVIATVTTGADGGYSFTGVTPGAYTVRETDPAGFTSTTNNNVPVSVSAGGTTTANFGNQEQGTVSGTVFNDPNGDGIQDPSELGIGGVTVQLLDSNGNVIATVTTGGDGSYSFPNVPPGAYAVRETDPSGFTSTSPNTVPISVAPGGAATANFGDQQQGSVSGTVFNDLNGDGTQDPGEDGINGVTVDLLDVNGNVIATVTAGPTGGYSFTSLSPGTYAVRETDPASFTSTTLNTVPVSVPPGGAAIANFGDQQRGTVSGVVFNDINGDGTQDPSELGIGGVTMELLDANGNVVASTTTGADGGYSFTGVTPGAYTVRETDPSGFTSTTSNTVPISVAPGGAAAANFGNQLQGAVSGVVFNDLDGNGTQDPGEAGIGGVTVTLTPAGGGAPITVTTAGDGSYLFIGVTPGSYTVTETDPAGFTSTTSNTVPVTVPAGGAANANFGDQQPGTIAGMVFNDLNGNGVRDPGEPGIGGVTIELLDGQGNVIATTTTTSDGRYVFTDIPPGAYTVRETDPSGFVSTTPNTRTVTVPPGGNVSPDFGDQRVGSINGAVFNDLDGNGVRNPGEPGIGGVTIELIDANGSVVATTTTVGNGDYSFTGVLPGNYTVREIDPSGFASTTPNTVPVTVPSGGSTSVQFGDLQSPRTVVGVVFSDLNGNGTQDAGETGIAGVTVTLTDEQGNVVATTTDANGDYSFAGLPPGTYVVTFTPPPGSTLSTDESYTITLRPGETVTNVSNFGLQPQDLPPPPPPTDIPTLSEVAMLALLALLLLAGWRNMGQTARRRTRRETH